MLNLITTHIRNSWKNIAAFVDEASVTIDEKTRLKFYTVVVILGIPTLVIFGLFDLMRSNYILSALIFTLAAGLPVGLFFLCKLRNTQVVYRINAFLFCLLLSYTLMVGGRGGSKILWFYISPLIAFFLFGKKEGLFWSGGLLAIILGLLWEPFGWLSVYPYPDEFKIRFVVTYLIVSVLAYFFEYLRHQSRTDMESKHQKLQTALEEVKTLSGLIPICASCKKIKDDEGYWNQVEKYIRDRSEAEFSHGICPDCAKKFYPEIYESMKEKGIM